jgi:hypothetical protein
MSADSGQPTLDLVQAKIAVVFADREPAAVLEVLDRYGVEKHEQERRRVQLAILKLCDEAETPDLEGTVEYAKQDFRDALAWAESPNLGTRFRTTDGRKREKLAAKDREQYLAWLSAR